MSWSYDISDMGMLRWLILALVVCLNKQVLRSYDNRVDFTERRPTIYLEWLKDTTQVVCEFPDCDKPLPFGHDQNGSQKMTWLWSFGGQLQIISTPYHKGCHWAEVFGEFLPIAKQLRELHNAGYVHGDIRCFNTVFPEPSTKREGIVSNAGYLIDFDNGGKVDERSSPRFPVGYQESLADGFRRGKSGQVITKLHDWQALQKIIFRLHPVPLDAPRGFFIAAATFDASIFRDGQSEADTAKDIDSLVNFLVEFQDCEVKLDREFAFHLNRNGLDRENFGIGMRQGTTTATGSLQKSPML
jgi:hypothetical protein